MASKQFIKYENTVVEPERSADEIRTLCRKYGAVSFQQKWNPDTGRIESVRFIMQGKTGPIPILLQTRHDRIFQLFREHRPRGSVSKQRKQAYRVAWRHMKDLTEQMLLSIHLGTHKPEEMFLGIAETDKEGVTIGEFMSLAKEAGHDPLSKLPLLGSS